MADPWKIPGSVLLAILILIACGGWLYTQNALVRLGLGVSLAVAIVVILWKYGILSGGADPANMDRAWQALAIFLLVSAMLFTLFSIDLAGILVVWVLVMAIFAIFLATLGVFITGRPMGIFVNSRNRMSLSTLQTILWTVILLSAFFTVAAAIIQAGEGEKAFNIALDENLWILMGISVTTLAGTPLILDVKSRRRVSSSALREYATLNVKRIRERVISQAGRFPGLDTSTDEAFLKELMDTTRTPDARLRDVLSVELDGPLYKGDKKEASVLDLFRGDEGVDWERVDLGKVQMFFFTVIGALAYMLVLGSWISTLTPETIVSLLDGGSGAGSLPVMTVNATMEAAAAAAVIQFPVLSDGFVAILGISHAGFLGKTASNRMPGQ